jgi:hypothetical protein
MTWLKKGLLLGTWLGKNIITKIKWIKKRHNSLEILWYARLGSNQRLSAPEADALSTELRAHLSFIPLIPK